MFSSSMTPSAISRSAITVGLSVSSSTRGSLPLAIWRARWAAITIRLNRFGSESIQSSTVTRAMKNSCECVSKSEPDSLRNSGSKRYQYRSAAVHGFEQQVGQPLGLRPLLAPAAQRPGPEDAGQVVAGPVEVVVDDDEVELHARRHLVAGLAEPALDDVGCVGAAAGEARFQHLQRRRQDEHLAGLGVRFADLGCALDVDFQQHVLAGGPQRFDPLAIGAVVVPEYLGMFQEAAFADPAPEGVGIDEMVGLAIDLAGPGRAGGVGDRKGEVRKLLEQAADQAGLAGAAGGGDDVQLASRLTRHSGPARASARSAP